MTTYPRNGSASAGKLLLNAPKIPRPHNLARNSPTHLSNIETRTAIFRGFQGVLQNTLRGITCEIWGSLSGTCGIDGFYRGAKAVTDWARGMRQTADPLRQKHRKSLISSQWVCTLARFPLGTIRTSTQRLPTPPRRPTVRIRIGYEHADRLRRSG